MRPSPKTVLPLLFGTSVAAAPVQAAALDPADVVPAANTLRMTFALNGPGDAMNRFVGNPT